MAEEESPHLQAFHEHQREAGESVLCWVHAAAAERGVAVLTDRRLAFHSGGIPPDSVPVTGPVLRYQPNVDGDSLYARFETDAGTLAFTVEGEEEQAHFGNLLGNLADLREAQAKLEEAGLDPGFVSPAQEGADEGVSAAYQLIRLKEMLNRGLLGEIEFMIERIRMIDRFKEQASAGAG